jgi:hypothetical protein
MSKLEIESYYRRLVKTGIPEDLIALCMAEKFPEAYDKESIVDNFKRENELILQEITNLGFKAFHENIIAVEDIDGESGQTDEEGTQASSEETAGPETEPVAEGEADC